MDAFYEAATAAGGKDNGPPGIRAHYDENYYAAFVHDVDGNNIEAVCQKPQYERGTQSNEVSGARPSVSSERFGFPHSMFQSAPATDFS